MLGDAYAFIDPVFSSGVHLAMQNGFDAVPLVVTALDAPSQVAAARARFDKRLRHGPKEFSWFIYRVTNPMMREFFMYPQNPLRVKEALLSLLAGDIFGKTPIWRSLSLFKAIYYIASTATLPRTLRALKRRRVNIRDAEVSTS
jgi:flavin-dependent dehydrogenase